MRKSIYLIIAILFLPICATAQDITAEKTTEKNIKTMIMGQFGYSPTPQLSYGAMLGQTINGLGWYINGRSNYQEFKHARQSCDELGMIGNELPFYSGNTHTTHLTIHAGFMMNIIEQYTVKEFNTFGFYIGGGYGRRELLAETTTGEWIKYAPTSHNGFSGNLGLYGSLWGVTLNLGVNTINFKYVDLEVGIGYMF